MPEVGSQNTTSAGYFHFLFGNLNPGGNESMTKQRIGVLVVSALLALASLAQAPPAKQKPAAKKSGGAVSGGPVMPGSEQWMDVPAAALVGTPSVEMGGTLKIAILQGDPMTAGRSFTVRLSGTDGTKIRSEEHTSELQSRLHLVCRLLLEKKKTPSTAPFRANTRRDSQSSFSTTLTA